MLASIPSTKKVNGVNTPTIDTEIPKTVNIPLPIIHHHLEQWLQVQ